MTLVILIILATVFYTLFDLFASRAGLSIDPNLSSVIFNGIGALIPLVVYGIYKYEKGAPIMATTKNGVLYSLLAGISIAVFSILLITIFEKGEVSYVVPVIYGGTIALASLFGWLFFKEIITPLEATGIAVILIGVFMIIWAKAKGI